MDIKSMNYTAASGGTFTIGTEVNGKIKHEEIPLPNTLGNLITVLKGRVDSVDTIDFQICKTQSLSEERMIINYKLDPETFQATKTIINVSDLKQLERQRYNNLIKEVSI